MELNQQIKKLKQLSRQLNQSAPALFEELQSKFPNNPRLERCEALVLSVKAIDQTQCKKAELMLKEAVNLYPHDLEAIENLCWFYREILKDKSKTVLCAQLYIASAYPTLETMKQIVNPTRVGTVDGRWTSMLKERILSCKSQLGLVSLLKDDKPQPL